uniref:BED-type domain-containing protein n=3 Tax=Graphocephala atropunctata TaxID=36148 RepID=A0A1B6LF16_9HEMI
MTTCTPSTSTSSNNFTSGTDSLDLPWLAYNKFFKLLKINEKGNYIVKCKLCLKGELSVSKNSPYNMRLHFERKHGCQVQILEDHIKEIKKANKRPVKDDESGKQSKLFCKDGKLTREGKMANKSTVDKALVDWVVDGMHSFTEVERPSFVKLWTSLSNHNLMCRKTLVNKMNEAFEAMTSKINGDLAELDHVCITADCWTVHYKSYLGITCHWIDPDSLERKNIGLSCSRIIGKHTYDILGKAIAEVLLKFKIQNKVVLTVTDSGSNFVKAFKEYGQNHSDVVEEEDDDLEFIPLLLDDIFENGEENKCVEADSISLPPHRRCAAHMLNLIGTKDIEKAMENDAELKKISRTAFGKCQGLWNKARKSSKAADTVRQHIGVNLKVPVATRWNSFHSSVNWICRFFNDERMNLVCDELGLPRFKTNEVQFLKEYCEVLEPLTKALDILQGEQNVCLGYLAPTLHRLIHFLGLKLKSGLKYCNALANAVMAGVQKRFQRDLWCKDVVLAACFHPRFKLAWIEDDLKKQEAKNWMEEVLHAHYPQEEPLNVTLETEEENEDFTKGFFNFNTSSSGANETTSKEELEQYLQEGVQPFKSLCSRGYLKPISIQMNTPIPSSASVERLFSAGGNIWGSKRARLTDTNFEHQLLLKYNKFSF